MQIGSPEGIMLLEFETVGEEIPQEIPQQEAQGEGEHIQEDLPECPYHKPSSYLKGKPRSILSLLCFCKYQFESFMFDALGCWSWMETFDAYTFLVQKYYLNPM
jgi:hypothetical protein